MDSLAKPKNRALFLVSVAVTGAFAGAAVWLFFFVMEHGIDYLWTEIPHMLGVASPELASGPFGFLPYPFFVCLLGGLLIGLYEKLTGTKTDDLNQVMAKVKQDGRYPYDNLGKLSLAALLPLLFGGSIGPEAGLTGVIAGLCSWVGDRMRRFGAEFRELTLLGTQAALTALFTAPVFGFVAPLAGSADGDEDPASDEITIKLPKAQKTVVYGIAIAGGLGTYLLLGQLVGGGMGMPRFESAEVGNLELTWLIPLALVGTVCGWLYFVSEHASEALSHAIGERPVVKAMLAGLALAICGTVLPYTMFAGETQADVLMETYLTIPAGVLIATGLVKAMLTPALINLGWRGGHFFPVIFSGASLGYGLCYIDANYVATSRLHGIDDGCGHASAGHGRGPAAHVFPTQGYCLHDHRRCYRRRHSASQAAAQVVRWRTPGTCRLPWICGWAIATDCGPRGSRFACLQVACPIDLGADGAADCT